MSSLQSPIGGWRCGVEVEADRQPKRLFPSIREMKQWLAVRGDLLIVQHRAACSSLHSSVTSIDRLCEATRSCRGCFGHGGPQRRKRAQLVEAGL